GPGAAPAAGASPVGGLRPAVDAGGGDPGRRGGPGAGGGQDRRRPLPAPAGGAGPGRGDAVMDAATQQRLQDLVGRERLSELMYVGQAFPWAPWHDSTAREVVMHLVTARRHTLIELGKWMGRHHI